MVVVWFYASYWNLVSKVILFLNLSEKVFLRRSLVVPMQGGKPILTLDQYSMLFHVTATISVQQTIFSTKYFKIEQKGTHSFSQISLFYQKNKVYLSSYGHRWHKTEKKRVEIQVLVSTLIRVCKTAVQKTNVKRYWAVKECLNGIFFFSLGAYLLLSSII